jgi:cyclase
MLLEDKTDTVLATSFFHFGTYTVGDVKQFLAKQNIPVRI